MKRVVATLTPWLCGAAYVTFAAADETAAVRAVIQKAFDAERTGHADTLPQYFLPEVTGFFLNGTLRTQGLFIPWSWAAYASGYRQNLQVSQLEVTVYDNTAFATGYVGGSISFPGDTADGRTLEGPWRASWVLRKHGGAWYPYCPPTRQFERPLLILIGEKDDWTPAAHCVEMEASVHRHGAPVILNVYPGATHAFDVPRFSGPYSEGRPTTYLGHTMNYDAQATEGAKAKLKKFIDQHLKGVASADQSMP